MPVSFDMAGHMRTVLLTVFGFPVHEFVVVLLSEVSRALHQLNGLPLGFTC